MTREKEADLLLDHVVQLLPCALCVNEAVMVAIDLVSLSLGEVDGLDTVWLGCEQGSTHATYQGGGGVGTLQAFYWRRWEADNSCLDSAH